MHKYYIFCFNYSYKCDPMVGGGVLTLRYFTSCVAHPENFAISLVLTRVQKHSLFFILIFPFQPPHPLNALPLPQRRHHESRTQGLRRLQKLLHRYGSAVILHRHLSVMCQDCRAESIPYLMVRPGSLCLSQNIIHSVRIPRIEATQPKITVPIPLGPHCEPCWGLSEVIVGARVFTVDAGSEVWVLLLGSVLLMMCNIIFSSGTMFAAGSQRVCKFPMN